jgi:N-carbamoyl-L-amino-acid hydrolase
MGMLFVPSRQGRSHCPEEWTEKEHVAKGTEALLRAVLAVDRAEL